MQYAIATQKMREPFLSPDHSEIETSPKRTIHIGVGEVLYVEIAGEICTLSRPSFRIDAF